MSRLRLWVGLIVLFGAGALTGIVATCLFMDFERTHRGERGPAAQHERIMKRLTHELSLTPQQQTDIEPIVSRAHVAILELRFAHQAEIEQILAKGMAELKEKLSSAQQPELDRMYRGLQQRWQVSREYLDAQKKMSSQ
ncbi:MAG TPA: hypothetical protein VFD86_05670 [Nitrospira sp.]|nr:hypothetical protein [Nitrospira sp.]